MSERVLVVDDEPSVRRSLAGTLADAGYEVDQAESAAAALARLAEDPPELVLSDVRMPGTDGLELLELVRERAPFVDVVLMTAYDEMGTVVRAMREGAFDFLVKPLDMGVWSFLYPPSNLRMDEPPDRRASECRNRNDRKHCGRHHKAEAPNSGNRGSGVPAGDLPVRGTAR